MKKILDEIVEYKKEFVKISQNNKPLSKLESLCANLPHVRDFPGVLTGQEMKIIAEIKRTSPSKGVIRKGPFHPAHIAKIYEQNGVSAISVLTDEKYFQGKLEYLSQVKNTVSIPVLRKDFIIDSYQLYESRLMGADAVLLIVAVLTDSQLYDFSALCNQLGLHPLVEVHSLDELDRAVRTSSEIIGINNRDLETFEVDLTTTLNLISRVPPDRIVVSESGIKSHRDMRRLSEVGVDAVLVGESLMEQEDIGGKLRELSKGIVNGEGENMWDYSS